MSVTVGQTIGAGMVDARNRVDGARASLAGWTIVVVVAAIALIGMAELERLIASVVDVTTGASHSFSAVIGPLSFTGQDAWASWSASPLSHKVGWWVLLSVVLDVAFVIAYASITFHFVKRYTEPPHDGEQLARRMVTAILVVEGLEALVLVIMALGLFSGAVWLPPWVEAGAAFIKWVVIIVLAVIILRIDGTRRALGKALSRGWQALWFHRLSAVPVALLAVLACVPAEGVLDQLPDVQRQWVGSDDFWRHFLSAFAAIVIAAIAAFALGRARTRRSLFREILGEAKVERSVGGVFWWWMLPVIAWTVPAAIAFFAAIALRQNPWHVFGWGAAAFVAVPLLALGASRLIERRGWTFPLDGTSSDTSRAVYAWLTGDLLAVGVIAVGGLGLVRSMALPVLLAPGGGVDIPGFGGAMALLLIGLVVAMGSPLILGVLVQPAPQPLRSLVARNDPTQARTPPATAGDQADVTWRSHQRWQLAIIGGACLILLALAVLPGLAAFLGPVATTVVVVVCWTGALGAFAVALQQYEPLAVFRWMRLRATPVLTLGLIIPLIYGALFSASSLDGGLHRIRMLPQASDGPTTTIADRLADNDCVLEVDGEMIKPVILVAAEGGGIRAAYWTGRAMEELTGVGCLDTTVLVSSGISGGSVGLTLVDIDGDDSMTQRLTELSSPDTLATAVSGLFVGDAMAAALGVKLPSYVAQPAEFEQSGGSQPFGLMWRDRAALIETGWISDVHGLAAPYTTGATTTAGFVLLNSTDVDSGCRVIIGSAEPMGGLETLQAAQQTTTGSTERRCEHPTWQPAVSWWLGDKCQALVDRATAMMLSARFPVVTPAGRLPDEEDCDSEGQLVDGGYAEGTGLGTLADVAPQITAMLRDANATAEVPLVPIVVYLRNSSGFDLVESLSDVTAEPLVPLVGYAAKAQQLTDTAWLQRLSGALSDVCGEDVVLPKTDDDPEATEVAQKTSERNDACHEAVAATRGTLSGQTVVVAPETRPAVVPPLGWALSTFSRQSLEDALTKEMTCDPDKKSALRPVHLCTLLGLAE